MSKCIVADSTDFSTNLYDVTTYQNWLEQTDIIALLRTSPPQNSEPGKGEYQEAGIREFAKRQGIHIDRVFAALGESGHRIGEKTTPQEWAAIEYAQKTGYPIVAFDATRFCREVRKLARFADVTFISLMPLDTSEAQLKRIRKRAANKHNPAGKGGRPRDMQAPFALPFIMSRLGESWSKIARELGEGWNDNKAKRLFYRYFDYTDTLN